MNKSLQDITSLHKPSYYTVYSCKESAKLFNAHNAFQTISGLLLRMWTRTWVMQKKATFEFLSGRNLKMCQCLKKKTPVLKFR